MIDEGSKKSRSFTPWRSAGLGWLVAALFLIVGIPLFLRMPVWCDMTLYQTAARNMLTGGAHYRDVFDTNPPGFPLCVCAVELVLGQSSEAIRIADLMVVGTALILALKLATMAGAMSKDRAWLVAGWASFYPFMTEFCHTQRDVWLLAPAFAAMLLRIRRVISLVEGGSRFSKGVVASVVGEGIIWALACWIKPHIVMPAAFLWLLTSATVYKRCAKPTWLIVGDALGIVLGTISVFAAGVTWLIKSGAWDSFVDVNQNWNNGYLRMVLSELYERLFVELCYFPPWSGLLLIAVPLAIVNTVKPFSKQWNRKLFVRSCFGIAFLSWTATTLIVQRALDYAHAPEVMMIIMLFAINRWNVTFFVILIQFALAIVFITVGGPFVWSGTRPPDVVRLGAPSGVFINAHNALNPQRTRHWFECFHNPSTQTRREVGMLTYHFGGIDPVELAAVAQFLKSQNIKDRELIAWHDSPHALYNMLEIKPGIRFMHLSTMQAICRWNAENPNYKRLRAEVAAAIPNARFVVSDMYRVVDVDPGVAIEFDAKGLPAAVPEWPRTQFPLDLPIVYRSPEGRYLVHRIDHPYTLKDCKIPVFMGEFAPW